MIKVEKTGNDVAISEVIGSTYDLIYEFHVALKAIYRVLDGSIAKSAPFDTEGFLHTMVHNVALKEERERDEHVLMLWIWEKMKL